MNRASVRQTISMFSKQNRLTAALLFLVASLSWMTWPAAGFARTPADSWSFPVASTVVLRDFWSPSGDYSAGHRGIDFATVEDEPVRAVADGVVRFAGLVAGRGVVSLALADGYVAEVEPVCAAVATGDQVGAGQRIGTVCAASSTHCKVACIHLSARRFSTDYERGFAYVTPLLFLDAFRPSHLVAIGSLN